MTPSQGTATGLWGDPTDRACRSRCWRRAWRGCGSRAWTTSFALTKARRPVLAMRAWSCGQEVEPDREGACWTREP